MVKLILVESVVIGQFRFEFSNLCDSLDSVLSRCKKSDRLPVPRTPCVLAHLSIHIDEESTAIDGNCSLEIKFVTCLGARGKLWLYGNIWGTANTNLR